MRTMHSPAVPCHAARTRCGVPPDVPTWGSMLSESRDHLLSNKWWLAVFPGLAIVFTVLAFNIIGDWLRDFLDPKLKENG